MPQAFPTKATWRVISATGSARRLESFGRRNNASQALVAFADPGFYLLPRRRRVPHEGIARSAQVCPAMPSVRSETNRGVSASSARSRSPRSFSPGFEHLSPTVAGEAYVVFKSHPHTNLQNSKNLLAGSNSSKRSSTIGGMFTPSDRPSLLCAQPTSPAPESDNDGIFAERRASGWQPCTGSDRHDRGAGRASGPLHRAQGLASVIGRVGPRKAARNSHAHGARASRR